jgi:hypothetical protein
MALVLFDGETFDPGKDRPAIALRVHRPGKAFAGVSEAPLRTLR